MKEVWKPIWGKVRQNSALTAGVLLAFATSGCWNDEQQPTPTLAPAPAVYQLQEGMPSATINPTKTPIPRSTEIPTPKVEIQQPKVISIGGSVETDPANPSVETIKLLFPGGIIDGKSPLIPKGDTLSVSLKLKSDTRINQLSLSLSDLLNIQNSKFSMGMSTANERDTANIASAISTFQRSAKFSINDADQKIIEKITLSTVRDGNKDLVVILSLPNEPFTYTDNDGSHLVNVAERFAFGEVGVGINRKDRPALTVENIKIANSKGKLVATANGFYITPQPTRIIPTETPTPPPTPTKKPEPPPTPTPTRVPTPSPIPTPTLAPTPSPSRTLTEKPKTYVKPGQELNWVQQIENKSYQPRKRSIDVKFQGGNEGNLKIEIRVPLNSDNIIPEGSVFIVPPRGVSARITAIVLPGASTTCFDSISFKLQSEEKGKRDEPLAEMLLDQNICIEETLLVFFSQHTYHEKEQLVISRLHFYNHAGIEQKTRFWVYKCSFRIAEREFISDSKKISPDEPVAIPPESIVTYFIYSTPPEDEKPSSPYCLVRFERILEK